MPPSMRNNGHKQSGTTMKLWRSSRAIVMPNREKTALPARPAQPKLTVIRAQRDLPKLNWTGNEQPRAWSGKRTRNAAAADLEAQLLADQASQREREEAERREQAERERRRAEKLAQQLNTAGKDEVESYYQAALESEAAARKQQVEDQKQAQVELLRDAEDRAEQLVARELQQQKELERQGRAMSEAGLAQQETRRRNVADRVEAYEANAAQARAVGQQMIEQGAWKPNPSAAGTIACNHAVRKLHRRVPEVEAKKRSFRNLFSGRSRASEDRRSESRAQVENAMRFRRLGDEPTLVPRNVGWAVAARRRNNVCLPNGNRKRVNAHTMSNRPQPISAK